MKEIGNEELKRLQLEILKNVHSFCERNQITYSLGYGTCLGAVRHKGFIPWDDDIDIIMPRPDYERFINSYTDRNYEVLWYPHDKDFPFVFGKVCDKRTVFIEDNEVGCSNMGVNIDVFPVDGLSKKLSTAKRHVRLSILLHGMMNVKGISLNTAKSFKFKMILIAMKALCLPFPYKTLLKMFRKSNVKYSFEESMFAENLSYPKFRRIVPAGVFKEYKLAQFEDSEFMIPVRYDEYLRSLYGDYMQLPPESKRESHHFFRAYWK